MNSIESFESKYFEEGECIAIVHRLNEIDDKLILVPKGKKYTIKEIEDLIYFSEKHHKSIVIK